MKLIYLANVRIPTEKAHGLQIMKMCEAFAQTGTTVELIVPQRKNADFAGVDPFTYYGVERIFTLTYVPCIDPTWLTRVYPGLYIKVQGLYFAFAVRRHLKQSAVSNDTCIYMRDEYLIPFFISRPSVVWEAHTLSRKPKKYARFFEGCKNIIALTHSLRSDIIALGVSPDRIMVAGDGVDLESTNIATSSSEVKKELQLPTDKKIVLYTGHLYSWKGVFTLAEASAALSSDTLIVFVGGTKQDQQKMKDYIQEKKLNNIMVVSHQPPSRIPSYLQTADVLVLPNSATQRISSHYTSPLKLFEYMAARKPIVASALPSIKEVLNDSNAVLVEPDSVQALARGIQYVLDDSTQSQVRAAKAYADVAEYTWHKRALKIINFIQ